MSDNENSLSTTLAMDSNQNPESNITFTPFVSNPTIIGDMYLASYLPLVVSSDKFFEMYNLDIEDLVERNTFKESSQKGGNEIRYLSYSHAYRLFRTHFDKGWEVSVVRNSTTGGVVFQELGTGGYFISTFIHDGYRRSDIYQYSILSASNGGLYPDEVDRNGKPLLNSQVINKNLYRAICKTIALVTGIGLKLWTGEDIQDLIQDPLLEQKKLFITNLEKGFAQYESLTGSKYISTIPISLGTDVRELQKVGKDLKTKLDAIKARKATDTTVDVEASPATASVGIDEPIAED